MAVFSTIIQQKRVLDAGQLYFRTLTFGMTVPLFTEKKIIRWNCFFSQQNSTFDHLDLLKTKSRKIIHSKRSKVDNLNLHRKRSFIDQEDGNSPKIRRFTKF